MAINTWLLFSALVLTVIVMPGPAVALCISHGVSHGRVKSLATVTGLILSSVVLVALSMAGLGAILTASGTLFNIVKFAGAAYLIYLGIKMWRSRPALSSETTSPDTVPAKATTNFGSLLRTGFLVGISNPKDLLFFGALFPQFISPVTPLMPQVIIMTTTWCAVAFSVMAAYVALGAGMARRVNTLNAKGVLDRVTGSIFIAAGTALAWAKRANT
jgi:threonine/homoserine/homoserine lactone efflux protein